MLLQAQCSSYSIYLPHRFAQTPILSLPVLFDASQLNGFKNARLGLRKNQRMVVSAADEGSSSVVSEKKRKVVEHICLFKAKEDLSDDEEGVMLDYLYTTQYQMGGIVAISLGRVSAQNPENYTHGLYMRFERRESLANFYENPFYLKVLKEHLMPYCHVCTNMD